MKRRYCLLLGCILLATGLQADSRYYRVLGSFSNETNAVKERERLVRLLDVPVEIRFDNRRSLYRVVADASLVDTSALDALDSWLLRMDIPEAAATVAKPSGAAHAKEVIPLQPPAETQQTVRVETPQTMGPLYPAFLPGETLSAYCSRLPDSRLCQHPRMQHAIEQDRKLTAHRPVVQNACDRIPDPGLHKTCLEMQKKP